MMFAQADATRLPFADDSFDLVLGSPPYANARLYLEGGRNPGISRKAVEWVEFMLKATMEAVRVSKGLVLWVASGVTRDWCYWPCVEGLMWEWFKSGNRLWRPAFWHRVGIPGSGGKQWLRADIEYVLAFTKCEKMLPWADNTANGHPPKWAPGGEMSYRDAGGNRRNDADPWGKRGRGNSLSGRNSDGSKKLGTNAANEKQNPPGPNRRADGKMKSVRRCTRGKTAGDTIQENAYTPPKLANPGVKVNLHETREEMIERWLATVESPNCIEGIKVGGGLMGHKLAHENEAPFPLKLAQWFIRGWCPKTCCNRCGIPVNYDDQKMQNMRQNVQDLGFEIVEEQVLQQEVSAPINDKAARQMPGMQAADSAGEGECGREVLLPGVQRSICREEPGKHNVPNNDSEGVRPCDGQAPSESEQGRLRAGAQISDGKDDRPILESERNSPSQKRKARRQSTKKSGTDDKKSARLFAQAKEPDYLPEMRAHDCSKPICPSCGADLAVPGAIRPGRVLDPFSGSGTVVHAAHSLGRIGIGCDLRFSQCELGRRRMIDVQSKAAEVPA